MKTSAMYVALPLLRHRIAPLADQASVWRIYSADSPDHEELDLSPYFPTSFPTVLSARGVQSVICNGMSPLLLRLFYARGIQVSYGMIGTPDEIAAAWKRGEIRPDTGGRGRGRRRHRGRRYRR